MAAPSPIESPCVKVCVLDPALATCLGCHRTLNEIARWGSMSGDERSRVMAALPGRKALAEAPAAS